MDNVLNFDSYNNIPSTQALIFPSGLSPKSYTDSLFVLATRPANLTLMGFIVAITFLRRVKVMKLQKLADTKSFRSITVTARSKARTVFARSNTGVVGSNPTRCIDICVCVFILCSLSTGFIPFQRVLPTV
jgi:hypothetical protein